jgi:hypothetical protein
MEPELYEDAYLNGSAPLSIFPYLSVLSIEPARFLLVLVVEASSEPKDTINGSGISIIFFFGISLNYTDFV